MPIEKNALPQHIEWNNIGHWALTGMPGCPKTVAISHDVVVFDGNRGKGRGKLQHVARLSKAVELGYSYLICTVNSKNEVEKHILATNGWARIDSFIPLTRPPTDGSYVEVWSRKMEPSTHIASPHLTR